MKHLTTFRIINAIARTGSIRSAAEDAALTPSAVQRRLQSYESELGFEIFERLPKGVRLNAAGEIVIQHIREILAETARLQSRIADLSGLRRGHVAVGCSQALAPYFLPRQIARYQAQFPEVTFHVELLEHGAASDALENYSVDFVLVFDERQAPGFKLIAGFKQSLVAVMSSSHPLTEYKQLRLRQCFEYPVILPTTGFGGRTLLDHALYGKTFAKQATVQSNSFEFLKAQVGTTDAITFQIEVGAPPFSSMDAIVSRPIVVSDLKSGILWLGQKPERPLSVAVSRFVEQVSTALSERFDVV